MAEQDASFLPDMPDQTCPVCDLPVKFAAGYYDTKPLYRCASCGYVIKPKSGYAWMGIVLVATLGLAIGSCVAGRLIVGSMGGYTLPF